MSKSSTENARSYVANLKCCLMTEQQTWSGRQTWQDRLPILQYLLKI